MEKQENTPIGGYVGEVLNSPKMADEKAVKAEMRQYFKEFLKGNFKNSMPMFVLMAAFQMHELRKERERLTAEMERLERELNAKKGK